VAPEACGGGSMINSIEEHIYEAKLEAMKRGIEADAVAINDRLYYTKFSSVCGDIPMVCGLKCVYTNELPDGVTFAVFKSARTVRTKDEIIADLQDRNKELTKALDKAYEIIGKMI
jgi:hypothetical protein